MMAWLYTLAFFGTTAGLWRRAAVVGETAGRGWLFRNWSGAVVGALVGIIVLLMATAESTIVSLLGFVLAITATAAPWWPAPEEKTTEKKPAVDGHNDPTKIVHGKKLDVVAFTYRSQKGETTMRRIAVQMVGEWQFEGIDLDKGQERTFRYDSVLGDITSEETGEIQSPLDWRDSIR